MYHRSSAKDGVDIVYRIISDGEKALENNMYFAALCLALMLPDICGKSEYPTEKCGIRYTKWYDQHIGWYNKPSHIDGRPDMPYVNGEIAYQLRCHLLHQGTPDIGNAEIKEEACRGVYFSLIAEPHSEDLGQIYWGTDSSVSSFPYYPEGKAEPVLMVSQRSMDVGIHTFCSMIFRVAKKYCDDNPDRFAFIQCSFIEMTETENDDWQDIEIE